MRFLPLNQGCLNWEGFLNFTWVCFSLIGGEKEDSSSYEESDSIIIVRLSMFSFIHFDFQLGDPSLNFALFFFGVFGYGLLEEFLLLQTPTLSSFSKGP